ncbi:hypothetical protein KC953_03460 [Candidatus Saccharibacteria bacterium]|nr:hypothetical protein [Candidatus Saccharibacteria bacterium]
MIKSMYQIAKSGANGTRTLIVFVLCFLFASYFAITASSQSVSAVSSSGVSSVSTGDGTTCAVRNNKAYCWGQDIQYGYRNSTTKSTPQRISSSALNNKVITKISVGMNHACLIANAKVYCWGANNVGQLGDGTRTDRSGPTAVNMNGALKSAEIMDIATGDGFSCALATNSTVACWGNKANGRLGAGTGTSGGIESNPKLLYTGGVLAGKKVIRLARASNATMCAIAVDKNSNSTSTGNIYCWGFGINNGSSLPGSSTTGCLDAAPASYTTYFNSDRPVLIQGATVSDIDGQLGAVASDGTPTTGYMSGLSSDTRARYWGRAGYVVTYKQGSACATNTPTPTPTPTPKPTPTPTPKPTPTPTTPPVSDKCTNAYWATNPSSAPIVISTPTGGGRGAPTSGGRGQAYIPDMYPSIRLASWNKTTGGANTPGDHDMKNSQGQNIGNSKNKDDPQQQTTYNFTVYHLCKTNTGSIQYVQCNTTFPASLLSPIGGERAMVSATPIGTTGTGRGSTTVYSYTGINSKTCDPGLKPNHVLTGILPFPFNLILGSTTGVQVNPGSIDSHGAKVRLAANTTKYRYVSVITRLGQTAATTPPTYPSTQAGIGLLAGTAYEGNNGGLICVVLKSSGTYCDGHGKSTLLGQLGNGSFAQQSGPKQVYDATKSKTVSDLSTAGGFTCAVVGSDLECWGQNTSGQLGIGNTQNQSKPMRVTSWP